MHRTMNYVLWFRWWTNHILLPESWKGEEKTWDCEHSKGQNCHRLWQQESLPQSWRFLDWQANIFSRKSGFTCRWNRQHIISCWRYSLIFLLSAVIVEAIWMVDICLGSSVVELLDRVTGVSGSSPGPALYFHCIYKCLILLSYYVNLYCTCIKIQWVSYWFVCKSINKFSCIYFPSLYLFNTWFLNREKVEDDQGYSRNTGRNACRNLCGLPCVWDKLWEGACIDSDQLWRCVQLWRRKVFSANLLESWTPDLRYYFK